jgi:hypothetical protein
MLQIFCFFHARSFYLYLIQICLCKNLWIYPTKFWKTYCVSTFCLSKESKKILTFAPPFYSFQNLIVHQVVLTLARDATIVEKQLHTTIRVLNKQYPRPLPSEIIYMVSNFYLPSTWKKTLHLMYYISHFLEL